MDPRGRPIYKESSPWPGWIMVVFWGTMFVCMAAIMAAPGEAHDDRLVGGVILGATAVAVQWLVAGLSVRLYRDFMVMGLGSSGLIARKVRYDEIADLESVRYDPLRDFGGWGVRGTSSRRIWSARGNEAVLLRLTDGKLLYVGSDRPHRLEERIRAVAGTRLGSKGTNTRAAGG
jgi:hypothetical protein